MTRRRALVTGASAGLGAAFARAYALRGVDLVLAARRLDRLEALAQELAAFGVEARAIGVDLSEPDSAAHVMQEAGDVDILVNNAGFGLPGGWLDTDWASQRRFLQLMLTTPLELVHAALPGMCERGYGRILNVSSLAGFAPGVAGHTLYTPTKVALIRFTQSIRDEVRGSGVHATAVCPGFTRTEFHDVNATRAVVDRLPGFVWLSAEDVVRDAIRASERNQAITVAGWINKAAAALAQLLPAGVSQAVASRASRRVRG